MVGLGGEGAEGRMKGTGMVEAHELEAGAVSSSVSKKSVNTELPLVAKESESRGNLGMFNSDDEPVDEQTRERLDHMSNIEDVLLLSIEDEQPSIKKKGPKVSSDPLNPENNPLLQDPDSVSQGCGRLTANDKALLKAFKQSSRGANSSFVDHVVHLLASVQKTPDGKVDDNSKEQTKSQLRNVVAGEHNELAREVPRQNDLRRSKGGEETELLKGESEPSDRTHSKGEASPETLLGVSKTRHEKKRGDKVQNLNLSVDMRGWGYFPGFHPEITFSSFMQEFLFDEKCSVRVFLAWMTPPWSFTVRHQRLLESLLYFHPTACVVVFSDTMELDFFQNFTDEGYLP